MSDVQTNKRNQDALLFGYLGSHLIALNIQFIRLGSEGKQVGDQDSISASAFIISLDATWYLVTAGHVLGENIGLPVSQGRIKVIGCTLADYFGRNAKNQYPTSISFDDPKLVEEDWSAGLDIDVIQLRPLYVAGLKSNGVEAIPESHWLEGDATDERQFAILGFPSSEKEAADCDLVLEYVRPCIAGVTACDLPAGESMPPNPIFVGKLNSDEPDSIIGLTLQRSDFLAGCP